jgi:hypothetical protein
MKARFGFMNHRLQLFPNSVIRDSGPSLREWWKDQQAKCEDPRFFRSWLVYDAGFEPARASGRFDWNVMLGIALSLAISLGFWAAAGLFLARLW